MEVGLVLSVSPETKLAPGTEETFNMFVEWMNKSEFQKKTFSFVDILF